MEVQYNKEYLIKTILGDALGNFGVDSEKLLAAKDDVGDDNEQLMIATSLRQGKIKNTFKQNILNEDARIMTLNGIYKKKEAREIIAAFIKSDVKVEEQTTPMTLKQLCSSFVVKRDNPLNLEGFVQYVDDEPRLIEDSFIGSKPTNGEAVPFKFPVICSKEYEVTAGDLDLGAVSCVNNLYIDKNGNYTINNKTDLARYLYNYMNDGIDCYCGTVWKQ